MPEDKKDAKLSNKIEEEKIIEKAKPAEKEAGPEIIKVEKEIKPEVSPGDREKVLREVDSTEGEIGKGMAAVNIGQRRQQRKKQIEKILQNDLEEVYINLPPNKQKEFRTVGEQTANEINNLLEKAKVKIKKIINLIKKWLSIIPGVNKFFLEQEAKIKTDEILKLKRSNKK